MTDYNATDTNGKPAERPYESYSEDYDDTGESRVINQVSSVYEPTGIDAPTGAFNTSAVAGAEGVRLPVQEDENPPSFAAQDPSPNATSMDTVYDEPPIELDDATQHRDPHTAADARARQLKTMLMEDDEENLTKNQFTTVYDLIDQMEALISEGRTGLFSGGMVRVDRETLTSLMDELKDKLPVQLERASALMRESERRLENAQTQANAIVSSAQSRATTIIKEANEQAQFLAGQENVVAIARKRARGIIDKAQNEADKLVQGADDYSTSVLTELGNQLAKLQHGVQSGLDVLAERQHQEVQEMPQLDPDDYPQD